MNKTALLFVLLLFNISCSMQKNSSSLVPTVKKLDTTFLVESKVFCEGHVTGAPSHGKAGVHLIWKAYYSELNPDAVVPYFSKQLGRVTESDKMCNKWRFLKSKPMKTIDICSKKASGQPWNRCIHELPSNAKSIIMQSIIIK